MNSYLVSIGAHTEAIEWAGNRRTLKQVWADCPRADWLIWVALKAGVARRIAVRAACDCVRTTLCYVPKGEDRPRLAIEAAEAWCQGAPWSAESIGIGELAIYGTSGRNPYKYAALAAAYLAPEPDHILTVALSYATKAHWLAAEAAHYALAEAAYYTAAEAGAPADVTNAHLWSRFAPPPCETFVVDMAALVRKRIPWDLAKEKLPQKWLPWELP